ncbi:low affinity iron permease family protein [Caulobacter sp. KR2-114]|uniref:low affinity iron permease family protein n=1 Tax=Caulobacter sp. KR2-114 TaxID=3400912 RepID=UPI003C107570
MNNFFETFANRTSRAMGRPMTFVLCVLLILAWALSGPMFHFSDTWQLVINTGTTIITFLMVFLIQNSQNREGEALQAKLDELIRALDQAQNRFIALEKRPEQEILEMREACEAEAGEGELEPSSAGVTGSRSVAAVTAS